MGVLHQAFKKVERAERLIDELDRLFKQIHIFDVREFIVDSEAVTGGREVIMLRYKPVTSDEHALVLGEAVYQLRSSLDVATVALARLHSPGRSVGDVYFPFAQDDAELREPASNSTRRLPQFKIRLLSPQAKAAIVNHIKPYPSGNALLCGLNELRNHDAHIELLPMNMQGGNGLWGGPKGALVEEMIGGTIAGLMVSQAATGRFHDGFKVDLTGSGIPATTGAYIANKRIGIATFICFNWAGPFSGEPVIECLSNVKAEVSKTLEVLEAAG